MSASEERERVLGIIDRAIGNLDQSSAAVDEVKVRLLRTIRREIDVDPKYLGLRRSEWPSQRDA